MKRDKKEKEGIAKPIKVLNRYYLIKPISAFLGTIWFSIVIKYWGVFLKLVDADSKLTAWGWILTVLVYGLMLWISIVSVQESKILVSYETNMHIYEHLIKSLDDLCDSSYDRILEHLKKMKTKVRSRDMYKNTVEPIKQLKDISREIKECFSEIADFQNDDLVVSMAYNFPAKGDEWYWVDSKYMEGGLSTRELFANKNSTFYHVAHNEDFIFYSDKKVAYEDNCYIYDSKDRKGEVCGSIVCMKIPVLIENEVVARIILSVSSYGVLLCTQDKEDAVGEIIEKILLRRFSKRIRIELAHLYIKSEQIS